MVEVRAIIWDRIPFVRLRSGRRGISTASLEAQFASFVRGRSFPCLGAKAAFNSGSYLFKAYDELASSESSGTLATDLKAFTASRMPQESAYATFIAVFRAPANVSEKTFEKLLWSQLQQLIDTQSKEQRWDPSVSPDPADPRFSFSFGGRALYVVGMHSRSSRLARRFPWPVLVFNPHEQFERLRTDGKWRRMQAAIRKRDFSLQGDINPMLSDFGEVSESRQYSGRAVEKEWKAPFDSHTDIQKSTGRCPFAPRE